MMFERLEQAARRLAQLRVQHRVRAISETLREIPPRGIKVELTDTGVSLSGRGLKRRLTLDPQARVWTGRAR